MDGCGEFRIVKRKIIEGEVFVVWLEVGIRRGVDSFFEFFRFLYFGLVLFYRVYILEFLYFFWIFGRLCGMGMVC